MGKLEKVSDIFKLQKSGDLMIRVQEGFPYFFSKNIFLQRCEKGSLQGPKHVLMSYVVTEYLEII